MQSDLFGCAGRTDAPEVLAAHDADYTPIGPAVQTTLALREELAAPAPQRVLDPSTGSGCFPRVVRAVYGRGSMDGPRPLICGVEIRESERANVADACDRYAIRDAMHVDYEAAFGADAVPFDLILTNPPFGVAFAPETFWPRAFLGRGLLAERGIIAMYGLSQWGQGEALAPVVRAFPPVLQIRCGGRPAHREDGQTDSREYSLWVWREGTRPSRRPSWRVVQLPILPAALRRWSPSAIPGTFPIDQKVVDEIRSRYL